MGNRKKRVNLNPSHHMDVDAWRERQIAKRLKMHQEQQEQEFLREHGGDTDAELREYVRRNAAEFGRMPHPLEIPGGEYLKTRLGDWHLLALDLGYLPVSNKRGQIILHQMKQQEEEAFLMERRALRAEKKMAKITKDKQTKLQQVLQAEKEKEQKTHPE